MNKHLYKNILVIQTAFIGDAILASSVLEKLHIFFPNSKISLLVRKGNESLYQKHPYINQLLVWDKQQNKYKNLFAIIKQVRQLQFDTVINLHRYSSSGLVTVLSKAKYTTGFKAGLFSYFFTKTIKHQFKNGLHETHRYNKLIEDITNKIIYKPKLYPTPNCELKIQAYQTASYVCMAPLSVWVTKQLPITKWVELCNQINTQTTIYILGAPSDENICNEFQKQSTHPRIINLAGKLSLLESTALMAQAQMNYVNDSAPLHLASSVNAPTIAFFCSTSPLFGFYPLSDNSQIIEVDKLSCKPCGIRGFKQCPLQHFKCGNEIVVTF